MQDKRSERGHFDAFTKKKTWNAFTPRTYSGIIALFRRLLKPSQNDHILDMGCGTGELTRALSDAQFSQVEGYDISKNCVALAKREHPGLSFKVCDIEKTGLKANSVDILFYCGILHHFTDQRKVIAEAKRILKKNGKVFIFEPNAKNPVLWLFRDERSPFKSTRLKTPNEKFLTVSHIKSSFEKQGFATEKIGCTSNIHYTREYFEKLLPSPLHLMVFPYNLFDTLLHFSPLRRSHGSFIYGYFRKP